MARNDTYPGENAAFGESDNEFYECQGEDVGEEYTGRLGPENMIDVKKQKAIRSL